MFKKILGTGITRVLNLMVGFATMLMGTKVLGAAEWGIGFTILTDVTFLMIGIEFIVGSGLVYFTSRKPLSTLMKVSYSWIVFMMAFYVLAFWILSFFPDLSDSIVPRGYEWITLLLTFVYSFHNFNLNILLGKEKVGTYNWVFLLQILVQVSTMALLIFVFHLKDAWAFVYSLLCGYVVSLLAGLTQVLPMLNSGESKPMLATAKEMLAYNSVIVLTSLVSILNRRISVFMLRQQYTDNDKEVGVYGAGTQVGEAVKVFGVSIAMVQFSHLSNLKNKDEAVNLTIKFLKISVILTFIALLVLACLPVSFFEWIFSDEFGQVKQIILLMAPGMLFYSAHSIFTHYFSGTGVPKYNLFATLVGLGVTLPCTLTMIPHWGILGAAASFSATFLAIMLYQWFVFRRISRVKAKKLLLTKEDWTWCKEEFYAIFAKNKK